MSASYRAVAFGSGNATSVTMTEPSGTVQGDLLIAWINLASAGTGLTKPTDFTTLWSGDSFNTIFRYNVAWCVRGSSAPTLNYTWTNAADYEYHLIGLSGAATTLDSTSADGGTGAQAPSPHNPDPPNTTATGAATLVLCGGMNNGGSDPGTWTAPSGYTMASNNAATGRKVCAAYKVIAGSGENPGAFSGAINADRDWWDGGTLTVANVASGTAAGGWGLSLMGVQ